MYILVTQDAEFARKRSARVAALQQPISRQSYMPARGVGNCHTMLWPNYQNSRRTQALLCHLLTTVLSHTVKVTHPVKPHKPVVKQVKRCRHCR